MQSSEFWQLPVCIFNVTASTTIDQGIGGGMNGVITRTDFGHYT